MKKPPTRKPTRAKAKAITRTPLDRMRMRANVYATLWEREKVKLNTANACVAKQIERIRTLESEVGTTYDRLQDAHHARDEKQCTIDRLCRVNAALHGEIETLNGQLLVKESSAKTNSSPPAPQAEQPARVTHDPCKVTWEMTFRKPADAERWYRLLTGMTLGGPFSQTIRHNGLYHTSTNTAKEPTP